MYVCVASQEMLFRCGGNVVEIGRKQLTVVVTGALILLAVFVYNFGFLRGTRRSDGEWVQLLKRVAGDYRLDHVERAEVTRQRKTLKTTGGLPISFLPSLVGEAGDIVTCSSVGTYVYVYV